MARAYLVVEGHGEVAAALNLVTRLWADLGLPQEIHWAEPIRGLALNTQAGVLRSCALLRSKRDCDRALLLRDEDDGCPAQSGPITSRWVLDAGLPFPVATVLAHREFEAWFLPCITLMAGRPIKGPVGERPGIVAGAQFAGDPEAVRGVKEWLSRHFDKGRRYKPSLDQLALTQMIDLPTLRAAAMPCFGTLERALQFLAAPAATVYPPVAPPPAVPTKRSPRKR